MFGIKGRRPSASIIVAVVALVAALGTSAVAGVTISKLNNKEKKQVKRLSKKQAKKLDRRAIKKIPAGPKGDTGPAGPKGDPGTAAAYAHVEYTGTVTESRSSNISDANISHPSPGVYCVGGLDFDIRHAQATPEVVAVGGEADKVLHILLANPGASPLGCSKDEELRVQTFDPSSGVFADHPFYLLLED